MKLSLSNFFTEISLRITGYVLKGYLNQPLKLDDNETVSPSGIEEERSATDRRSVEEKALAADETTISSLFLACLSDVYASKLLGNYKDSKDLTFRLDHPDVLTKLVNYFIRFLGGNKSDEEFTATEFGELISTFDYCCLDPKLIEMFWNSSSHSDMGIDELLVVLELSTHEMISHFGNDQLENFGIKVWILNDIWLKLCEYSNNYWTEKLESLAEIKDDIHKLPLPSDTLRQMIKGANKKSVGKIYDQITNFDLSPDEFMTEPTVAQFVQSLLKSERFIYNPDPNQFPIDLHKFLLRTVDYYSEEFQANHGQNMSVIRGYVNSINWTKVTTDCKVLFSGFDLKGHWGVPKLLNPKVIDFTENEPVRIIHDRTDGKVYYVNMKFAKVVGVMNVTLRVCGFLEGKIIPLTCHSFVSNAFLNSKRKLLHRKGNVLTCQFDGFDENSEIDLEGIKIVEDESKNVPELGEPASVDNIVTKQNDVVNMLSVLSARLSVMETSVGVRNRQ